MTHGLRMWVASSRSDFIDLGGAGDDGIASRCMSKGVSC